MPGLAGRPNVDLKRLDLNLLVILDALYEEGSLTRVAERLQLSQPTISSSLAKLRTALNDELFIRTRGMMQPTDRAMQLRIPVRKVLQTVRFEILEQGAFDPASLSETITISTSDVGELEFLPGLVERLAQIAPRASVRTVLRDPHSLSDAMDIGDVDVAIGYFPDLQASVFKQQVLFSHPSVCLVRRDHPLYGNGITLEQYREARHLIVSQKSRFHDVVDQALSAAGIERNIALTISHFVNVPPLIAQSDLVATIALPIATQQSRFYPITLLEPPFAIPLIQIKQVWHRRFDNSPKLVWLRRLIADMSQNKPRM
jgi:DNA-binding transcriptional LysR family regulator